MTRDVLMVMVAGLFEFYVFARYGWRSLGEGQSHFKGH